MKKLRFYLTAPFKVLWLFISGYDKKKSSHINQSDEFKGFM